MADAQRRGDMIVAGGVFGLALLLGGGSILFPIQRMLVELGAALGLAWFVARGWRAETGSAAKIGLGIGLLTIALIIVQIIPLPPSLWTALPGRELPADVMSVAGAAGQWLPISLDPTQTRAALFFFLVPFTLFVATLHLKRDEQRTLLVIFVAFTLLNAVLVAVQSQGLTALTLYWTTPTRPGFGLFANKNHCAVMLVAGMPVAVAMCEHLLRARTPAARYVASAAILMLLSVSVFGCLSRAGLLLLPFGLAAAILMLVRDRLTVRTISITLGLFVMVTAVAFFVLPRTHVVAEALQRFGADSEGRYNFWPDVLAATRTYFPVGSGLGTFVPVFTIHETLENVHLTYTNHAHSDYLEILLETGVAGGVLAGAFILWFLLTGWRRLRDHWLQPGFNILLVSATTILLLLVHSAVDYPLRTLALSGAMAVCAAILASSQPFPARRSSSKRPARI